MRRAALALALAALAGCGTIQLDRPLVPAPRAEAPSPPLVQAWETEVDAAFGPAAATAGSGRLAVGTRSGHVVVLDGATGDRLGSLSFGAGIDGGVLVAPDGQTVYVPVARGRYGVVAHGLRDGRRRWAWRADSAALAADAGLALVGGVVVAPLHDGTTVGLDATAGTERWRLAGGARAQNHAAPTVLPGGLVAIADDRGSVRALDASTGAVRWSAEAGAPVYAAPVVDDGRLLVPTTRGTLVALDATSGRVLWTARLDATGQARVTGPAVASGRVVVGLTDGRVVALDVATGATVWTWAGTGAIIGAPLASGPTVYVGTMDKRLVALDAATGAETWSTVLRGRVKSALAVEGGRLVVLTEPRHVVAFQTVPPSAPVAARP